MVHFSTYPYSWLFQNSCKWFLWFLTGHSNIFCCWHFMQKSDTLLDWWTLENVTSWPSKHEPYPCSNYNYSSPFCFDPNKSLCFVLYFCISLVKFNEYLALILCHSVPKTHKFVNFSHQSIVVSSIWLSIIFFQVKPDLKNYRINPFEELLTADPLHVRQIITRLFNYSVPHYYFRK